MTQADKAKELALKLAKTLVGYKQMRPEDEAVSITTALILEALQAERKAGYAEGALSVKGDLELVLRRERSRVITECKAALDSLPEGRDFWEELDDIGERIAQEDDPVKERNDDDE